MCAHNVMVDEGVQSYKCEYKQLSHVPKPLLTLAEGQGAQHQVSRGLPGHWHPNSAEVLVKQLPLAAPGCSHSSSESPWHADCLSWHLY